MAATAATAVDLPCSRLIPPHILLRSPGTKPAHAFIAYFSLVRIIYPPPPLFFLFLPLRSLHPLLHLHFTHSLRACVRAVIATGTPGGHIRSRTLSQIDLLYHACSARGRPHACCLSICQSVHMRTLARSCLPAPRLYTLFCTSLFTRTILFARPKLVHTLHLNMRHACMENKIVARHRRSQSEHQ